MSGLGLLARGRARFDRILRARFDAVSLARASARFDAVSLARASARFDTPSLRGALTSLALGAAAGCAQTDLVASYVQPCSEDGCPAPAECGARVCAPLSSQRALCTSTTAPVQAGDSCAADGSVQIAQYALCSCTDLVAPAVLNVDAYDATLSRPAPGAAALGVNGSLHVAQGGRIDGSLRAAGDISGGDLTGELVESSVPPCACAESALLDVEALARAARDDNDNASLGLDPTEFDGFEADRELPLPCGRYFLTRLAGDGALTIRARGNVALFVEGNVELDQTLELRPEPGARLSVFIAGEMRVGGAFTLGGDPSGSERAALYLGGRGTLNLRGSTSLVGALYAPRAELVTAGDLEVYGSLFVGRAALEGDLTLHQDVSLAEAGSCEAL
jgi:hypothetical protein